YLINILNTCGSFTIKYSTKYIRQLLSDIKSYVTNYQALKPFFYFLFIAATFQKTFRSLQHIHPKVVYPSLNFSAFDDEMKAPMNMLPHNVQVLYLSINRYERKKDLGLAILALAELKSRLSESEWKSVHLVMAGGYDDRVIENKQHYLELQVLVEKHQLIKHVTFLRSFSDAEKLYLLNSCSCLLYTPSNEHFGIVPIEAMYMSRPVIA
ncbi:alpha-1,3/1,6-mannosyltransferase ALG2-like, partial [Anneissia japonica]|uniref:alpha-1,3/1,6-mannosyltransferase ALG2-like n=1 Tax=Anneissia japonica TaxID=1529436 RepID=UPI0014259147